MSYVKALYGNVVGEDLNLKEGQIGYTERDFVMKDLEKRGILKLFPTFEEADAFKFVPSSVLFNQSYKTLNPPEGEDVPASKIDWTTGDPVLVDGIPANYIAEPVIEKVVEKVVEKTVKTDTTKTPVDPDKQ